MYAVANAGCQECEGSKPTVTRSLLKCCLMFGFLIFFFFSEAAESKGWARGSNTEVDLYILSPAIPHP